MSTGRTTAAKTNGHATYISGGANTQDGNLKLYTCNTCHRPVVWATSTKSGRVYLADVFEGQSGARYYVKASAHQCVRPADVAARETLNAKLAKLADIALVRAENDADPDLTDTQRARLNGSLDRIEGQLREQLAGYRNTGEGR